MKYFIVLVSVFVLFMMRGPREVLTQEPTSGPVDDNTEVPAAEPNSTTAAPAVNPAVVAYLNSRIRRTLRENPEKSTGDLRLAAIFNEKRARLKDAIIKEPAQEDDDVNAEVALENFRNFMQRYNAIEGDLENAIGYLRGLEERRDLPLELRFEALSLLNRLRESGTIKDAEQALRVFENFRKRVETSNTIPKPENSPKPTSVTPELSDEYKEYFEEILRILRKHVKDSDPKMQSLLQQFHKNPKQLKKLAAALKNLGDNDHGNEDNFWNLFSSFGYLPPGLYVNQGYNKHFN